MIQGVSTAFDAADWLARLAAANRWAFAVELAEEFLATLAPADLAAWTAGSDSARDPFLRLRVIEAHHEWLLGCAGNTVDAEQRFCAARRSAGLHRWQAGRGAWNAWAETMLELRQEAETTGWWRDALRDFEAIDWFGCATTDFYLIANGANPSCSGHVFSGPGLIDFSGFRFPHVADFREAQFGTKDHPADASFERAIFAGEARFVAAVFTGKAQFPTATFSEAHFFMATFASTANFEGLNVTECIHFTYSEAPPAVFKGDALFGGATFNRVAFGSFGWEPQPNFLSFEQDACFVGATFKSDVWFNGVVFAGDAGFEGVKFEADASFYKVGFVGEARFKGARFIGQMWFDEEMFACVPPQEGDDAAGWCVVPLRDVAR
jgi:uncharacterized protein YjbI with pentapeptide repeats